MTKNHLILVLDVAGVAALVGGIALISIPAALIVGGLLGLLAAIVAERGAA